MTQSHADFDICICTFRRPHLADTLRSVSQLKLEPGWSIRVIVADNDETPSANALAGSAAHEYGLALTYVHAPARNISVARNACLNAVTAPFFAFIDDDEQVKPGWLAALAVAMEKDNSDVALGPVQAIYGPDCPKWIRGGDFHSTKPVWLRGEIRTGYSCNVLLRHASRALANLRFREEFGRSGGEDTMFFAAIYNAGGRFAYAPDAVVTEAVPPERARFSWLLRRWFRSGQTHGVLLLENSGMQPLKRIYDAGIASGKALVCFLVAIFNLMRPQRLRYWILRGVLHAGVVSRLLGKRELTQYG